MKDLKNNDSRLPALAALNRMDNLVSETDAFYKLIELYNDPKIEKIYLSRYITFINFITLITKYFPYLWKERRKSTN